MINYSVYKTYSTVGDTTSAQVYHGRLLVSETMDFESFCQHLADHGCAYQKGDVMAIITLAVECLRELLLEGYRINLSDLGTFQAKVTSTAAASYDEFSTDNITGLAAKWTVGAGFSDMLADATFKKVISPTYQAAVVAALKAGETTVDLSSSSSSDDDEEDEEDSSTDE